MTVPPRIVTLVVDDPRGALPTIEVESPWWMESGPLVEAARLAFGVEITVVRLLGGDAFPGGPVTYLVEAPEVAPDVLIPWPDELADDDRRASYATPGAIASLTDWVDEEFASLGLARVGSVGQVRTWNLSCLLRYQTDDQGVFWLKAVPEFFGHEPDVMRALSTVDPTLVPELVATRHGTTLMREVGDSDGYDITPDRHLQAVERFDRARRRLDLGALRSIPRFGPEQMTSELASIAERHRSELTADEHRRLLSLVDEVDDRWAVGSAGDTLVHGDLHGGNIRLAAKASGQADTIIDWGDASVSHPLFDLAVLDSYTPEWGSEVTDRWLDLLDLDRQAWTAFRPLAAIRLAIVYRRFCDSIEASEQIYHRDDIAPAIRTGLSFFGE